MFAIVKVGNIITATVNYMIIHTISGTGGASVYSYAGDLELNRFGANILVASSTSGFINNTSIVSATNSTGNVGLFVNGSSQTLTTNNGTLFTAASSLQYIGGYASSAQSTTIGEVLVYDGILTTLQRQQIEGYLAWKWSLNYTLPANHPYKYIPPP